MDKEGVYECTIRKIFLNDDAEETLILYVKGENIIEVARKASAYCGANSGKNFDLYLTKIIAVYNIDVIE